MPVSIVIPVKNRATLLEATLASLAAQADPHWEALVVDDGSEDGTLETAQRWQSRDSRITGLRGDPLRPGACACRNLGVDHSRGEFVLFLDSDDALAPWCIEQRRQFLLENPTLDFAVWPTLLFTEISGDSSVLWNVETAEPDLDRFLKLDPCWQTASVLWRRSALDRLGPWNESLASWQDWEYQLRAFALGLRYARGKRADSYWRMLRSDSIGTNSTHRTHLETRISLLAKMAQLLNRSGLSNASRMRKIAGIILWHCQVWIQVRRNGLRASFDLLHACWLGLFPWNRFPQAFYLICLHRILGSKRRKAYLAKLAHHWPPEYFIRESPTKHKIVDPDV